MGFMSKIQVVAQNFIGQIISFLLQSFYINHTWYAYLNKPMMDYFSLLQELQIELEICSELFGICWLLETPDFFSISCVNGIWQYQLFSLYLKFLIGL